MNRFGDDTDRSTPKKKCRECPFRKTSAQGWLGSNDPVTFVHNVERGLPCHITVDYEADDWEIEQEHAPVCRGSLELMANAGMRPVDDELRALVEATPKADDVFNWPFEFVQYHNEASVRSWEMRL